MPRYDVLIAGGAVMGSSVALFLKRLAPACRADNFFVVAGFSGHGMMHAPAAGRRSPS